MSSRHWRGCAPGGRLVALVGEGWRQTARHSATEDAMRFAKKYNVRANIGISGEAYRSSKTTFDNQILVIDKTGPTKATPVLSTSWQGRSG